MSLRWCAEQKRVAHLCTAPAYTSCGLHLIRRGKAGEFRPDTVRQYMSRIYDWQTEGMRPDPTEFRARLRVWRKAWRDAGGEITRSAALTIPYLLRCLERCDESTNIGKRDAFALALAYHNLHRREELTDLQNKRVRVLPSGLLVVTASSKTGQELSRSGRGVAVSSLVSAGEESVDLFGKGGDVDCLGGVDNQSVPAQSERSWVGGPDRDAVADLLAGEILVEVAAVAFACPEPFSDKFGIAVAEHLDQLGVELVESGGGGVAVPPVDEDCSPGVGSEREQDVVAGPAQSVAPWLIADAEGFVERFQDHVFVDDRQAEFHGEPAGQGALAAGRQTGDDHEGVVGHHVSVSQPDFRAARRVRPTLRPAQAAVGRGLPPQRMAFSLRMRACSRRWAARTSGWRALLLRQRR